ncbi:MAG: hypothetical protein QM441_06005 [Synergistota bacterium]|jgi:hypothetical protein|nr:hypothetical protein [Synergistota bacterium]
MCVRLFVLFLSMGSVYGFGYALAGMGGFLLGRGRLDYIVLGLLTGCALAAAALLLWRRWLLTVSDETRRAETGRD